MSGQAWPDWVRILSWVILAVLGVQAVTSAIGAPDALEALPAVLAGLCFAALLFVAWHMQTSITTIDERGLRQSWYRRREVAWEDVRQARFVPMLFSKRLVIFTHSGRPVIFQGGTRCARRSSRLLECIEPRSGARFPRGAATDRRSRIRAAPMVGRWWLA